MTIENTKKLSARFELMLVVGKSSKYVSDNESVYQCVSPGLCDLVKVEGAKEPLSQAPGQVAEILRLFSQGLSLLPSVSKIGSEAGQNMTGAVKGTMKDFDVPNVRRLSVCPN